MKPRARKDDLLIQDLPEETLVYDVVRHRAHCLNRTAALVWRHCDGKTSVEKLARVSYYITKASREMAGLAAKLSLARDAMEHAVSRLIALRDDKGTIAAKTALLISKDKRLRNTKIEVMEAEAAKRALEHTLEALDVNWRTVSRALSVRMREPTE